MNNEATLLLVALARTTLWLAVIGLVTTLVLRLLRPNWPTAHRVAWCLVLLVGWTVLRLPVDVPWYAAPQRETPVIAELPAIEPVPIDDDLPALTEPEPTAIDLAPVEIAPVDMPPVELTTFEREAPAVAEPVPIRWTTHWPLLVVGAWLLGMAGLLSAWLAGYARFVRSLRWREPADDDWQAEWNELLNAAGVRRAIPLSVCRQFGPVLCRLPRGYELIVPESLWRELDRAERQAILRHELAHYQRGDVWKSLVVRLLALPHWFNPVAWLAVRRFEEAGEWACDRAATGGTSATEYAKILVRLGQQPGTFGYGSAARGRTLATRVRRILSGAPKEDSNMKKGLVIAAATALVAASVVRINLVARESGPPEKKDPQHSASGSGSPIKRDVVAGIDGEVVEVLVDHGDVVKQGQVVVRLRNSQLQTRHTDAYGELEKIDAQLASVSKSRSESRRLSEEERARLEEQRRKWAEQKKELLAEYERVTADMKKLQVRSPVNGKVVTWRLKEKLSHRPIDKGQVLLTIETTVALAAKDEAAGEQPTQPTPTDLQPPASRLRPVDDLSNAPPDVKQRLLEHAHSAYEATQAAYDAQTAPLQSLIEWSLKWMQSAEAVATNDGERLEAVRGHLQRMKAIQQKVELLYKAGSLGGEAREFESATFYLADAERRVAEAEAAAAGGETRTKPTPHSAEGRTDVLDLKIKIAELRGEQQEAVAEIGFAETALEKADKLFKIGANNVSRGNVERARATVTKWKSQLQTTSEKLELYQAMVKAIEAPAAASAPGQGATAKLQALDLKIRIAELRGRQQTAEAELIAAQAFMEGADMAFKSNNITRDVLERARADVAKWKSQLAATAQQLKLYEEKLKLVEAASTPVGEKPVNAAPPSPPEVPYAPRAAVESRPSSGKPELLYAGRDFEAWADDLRNDLSPQRRTEAIKALAAFGAHGHGRQAAEAIVEAMKGYSVRLIYGDLIGELKQTALAAFGQPIGHETATLPKGDALPVVLAALKSDNANQRLFAVTVLPNLSADRDRRLALIKPMLADSEPAVRLSAAGAFIRVSPAMPELLSVLRAALSDPEYRSSAEYMVIDYVKLLDGEEPLKSEAARALHELGPAAISGLELAARPDQVWVQDNKALERFRANAREMLDAVKAKMERSKPDDSNGKQKAPVSEPSEE